MRCIALVISIVLASGCQNVSTDPPALQQETFWQAGHLTAAQRLELAKRSEPELIAFLRRFPKGGDLHNHASGATYSDYQLDSARRSGMRYDPVTVQFTSSNEGTISIDELESDPSALKRFFETISMRGWYPNTMSGHDHFFETFRHIRSLNIEVLAELVERNRYQRVNYLELMMVPIPPDVAMQFTQLAASIDIADLESSFDRYSALIDDADVHRQFSAELDAWDAGVQSTLGLDVSISDPSSPVHVRYIGSLIRTGTLERFFGTAMFVFTAMRADPRVVGLNIVAPEDAPRARREFEAQMRILDFLWVKFNKPAVTLHAGELVLAISPVESMWDRIRKSIEIGHARRIGHGVSIAWERDLVGLLAGMRDDGVMVEINLTSNETILGVADNEHPFQMYQRAGVPMCITTDDEGVSRSNLTMEYVKAVNRYDLDYSMLKRLSRDCLEYSFLPGSSLYVDHDDRHLHQDFINLRAPRWQPSDVATRILHANPKIARQVMLERAFISFEQSLANGYSEQL